MSCERPGWSGRRPSRPGWAWTRCCRWRPTASAVPGGGLRRGSDGRGDHPRSAPGRAGDRGDLSAVRAARRGVRGRLLVCGGRAAPAGAGRRRPRPGSPSTGWPWCPTPARSGPPWWPRCSTGSTSWSPPPRARSPPRWPAGSPPGPGSAVRAPADRARWPGADLTLEVVRGAWHGLERGRGRLRRYEAEVLALRPGRRRPSAPGPPLAARRRADPAVRYRSPIGSATAVIDVVVRPAVG